MFWQRVEFCGKCFRGVCEKVHFIRGRVVGNFGWGDVAKNIFCTDVW